MKWKMILFVLSLDIAFSACEKKDISVFSTDDTGIYFQMIKGYYGTNTEVYIDSLDFSFASVQASIKDVILNATVRTMGKVVDHDRPFKVVVDKEGKIVVRAHMEKKELSAVVEKVLGK